MPTDNRTDRRATRRPLDRGVENRIGVLMAHTTRYAFEPQARLARDVGVSRSTISRLIAGKRRPSYELAYRVTAALEAALSRPLDLRDVFSRDGRWREPSGCTLCGCAGCMPEAAYDRHGNLKAAFRHMRPGDWSLASLLPSESSPPAQRPG
jgi:DNA-binding XRE family transcriptional regulator